MHRVLRSTEEAEDMNMFVTAKQLSRWIQLKEKSVEVISCMEKNRHF